MKRSRRELSVNVVIHRFIFKNNQITPFPCLTFIPKPGIGLPKTGFFFCASVSLSVRLLVLPRRYYVNILQPMCVCPADFVWKKME